MSRKKTCRMCCKIKQTTYTCLSCNARFCDDCNKVTTIDISPMTLFGYGYAIASYKHMCKKCMNGRTVSDIQDEERSQSIDDDVARYTL